MSRRCRTLLAVFGFVGCGIGCSGCASGPHPAIVLAARDFGCDAHALTLHEIFARKVRIEGCGKEAVYVKVCSGYGMDAKCGWAVKPAGP